MVYIVKKIKPDDTLALLDLAKTHLISSNILSRKENKLDPFMACLTVTKKYAINAKTHGLATKEVVDGLNRHLYQADGQLLPLSDDPDALEYFEEIIGRQS